MNNLLKKQKVLVGFLLMLLLSLPSWVFSQGKSVNGVVLDSQDMPLAGVSILIESTNNGTITDVDGKFTLKSVKSSDYLIFSYLGYKKQEIKVGNKSSFKVVMQEDSEMLEDVVVIGYGVQKKSDLTGSIASVKSEDLVKQATVSAAEALRGQIAGVNVINTGGKPGADMMIEIRGTNTIGQDSSPLVIIDGIEGDMSMFSALNPNSVEKVDVLKDASATAVYGSRGSNGVIIITTKSGIKGKNTVQYDGSYGIRLIRNAPDMMNGEEFSKMHDAMELYWGNNNFRLEDQERQNIVDGTCTDWVDLLVRNGMQTSHNLSVTGGDDRSSHYLSIGYTKEEGNLNPEGFERLSSSMKVTTKITNAIEIGGAFNINYTNTDLSGAEVLRSIYRARPTTRCFDDNGEPIFWLTQSDQQVPNPYFEGINNIRTQRKVQGWGNIFIDVKPLEFISVKSEFKPNFIYLREGEFCDVNTKMNAGRMPAYSSLKKTTAFDYTWDNTVTFNKAIKEHRINATGLFSMQSKESDWNYMDAEGFLWNTMWNNMGAANKIRSINSSLSKTNLMSFMLRFNYIYGNKYLFTVTGRADGSSRLSVGNQWGIFPSAALGYVISEEKFMKQFKNLSNLKVRFSYGVSGNDRVNPYSSFMLLSRTNYDFGGESAVGFSPSTLANKKLKWEKSEEFNLGLDLGLFSNRISFSADIYTKNTKDLILTRKLPTHIGYANVSDNIGALNNKGIELSLSTVNITNNDFKWMTNLNFAINRNKVVELYGDNKHDIANKLFVGYSVKSNYSYIYEGLWQIGEALPDNFTGTPTYGTKNKYAQYPGQCKVRDINNDGIISPENDMAIIGNMDPKWSGGMTNNFYYKGFDLSIFIYARIGEQKLSTFHETFAKDYNGRYNVMNYDYWTPENQDAEIWAPGSQADGSYRAAYNYKDCSFVKVGNITLGYEFPTKFLKNIKLERLRLYFTALNPFVFTKYDGWDPEWAERGCYTSALANTTLMGGINLSF